MIKTEKGVVEMRAANEPELLIDFACIANAMKDRLGEGMTKIAFWVGMMSDKEREEVIKSVEGVDDDLMKLIDGFMEGAKL